MRPYIHAKAKICKTGNQKIDTYNRGLYVRQVVTRWILIKRSIATERRFTHKAKDKWHIQKDTKD